MSQELQYDRQVTTQSEALKTTNLLDSSITDITIIDFDSIPAERSVSEYPPERSVPVSPPNRTIKRLTLIHRQNNIQSTQNDSITTSERSEQNTKIKEQNKSSPDKASHAISTTTIIIIISLILLAIILFISFIIR